MQHERIHLQDTKIHNVAACCHSIADGDESPVVGFDNRSFRGVCATNPLFRVQCKRSNRRSFVFMDIGQRRRFGACRTYIFISHTRTIHHFCHSIKWRTNSHRQSRNSDFQWTYSIIQRQHHCRMRIKRLFVPKQFNSRRCRNYKLAMVLWRRCFGTRTLQGTHIHFAWSIYGFARSYRCQRLSRRISFADAYTLETSGRVN